MDWVNLNYKLSSINNALECFNSALDGASKKQKASDILIDFGSNLINGQARNEIAYDIKRTTGSDLGIAVNDNAGYGSAEKNQKGMQDLMQASVFSGMYGFGCGCGGMGIFGGYPTMGCMGGMNYSNPGILGGVLNGYQMPSMRVSTPLWGTSTFNMNRFFTQA